MALKLAPVYFAVLSLPKPDRQGHRPATTTDHRDLMATVHLDGAVHHVEHTAPYSFPGDNGTTTTKELFGHGWHTVEFEFYLEGTTTKIGRGCVTVHERAS